MRKILGLWAVLTILSCQAYANDWIKIFDEKFKLDWPREESSTSLLNPHSSAVHLQELIEHVDRHGRYPKSPTGPDSALLLNTNVFSPLIGTEQNPRTRIILDRPSGLLPEYCRRQELLDVTVHQAGLRIKGSTQLKYDVKLIPVIENGIKVPTTKVILADIFLTKVKTRGFPPEFSVLGPSFFRSFFSRILRMAHTLTISKP